MEEKPHVDRSEEPAALESNQPIAPNESPRTSVLAILCVFCAALGFFLLPAIAAVPLGIGALRTIDASEGRLRGRHLAVVGLCVSVVALFPMVPVLRSDLGRSKPSERFGRNADGTLWVRLFAPAVTRRFVGRNLGSGILIGVQREILLTNPGIAQNA